MLEEEQISLVGATVPVLEAHGETLTCHFYERMFRHHPEVREFFNPAHQASGRQQRALAGAICAYAQHVANPGELADAIELIAQKHASLGVRAEHYPVVGEHLLASIREVLGEAASDDLVAAWGAAYGALADVFIEREGEIYAEQEATHGWQGFRPFQIVRREAESENIVSLYLAPEDGGPLAPHSAGQYITIRIGLADGGTTLRNYSLSNAPGGDCYRISVKREAAPTEGAPDGVCSFHIHDDLAVGDVVELSPPCGEFTLKLLPDDTRPLVLIAGGVGVTPIISMLHAALEQSAPTRPIVFIQCALNGAVHPFAGELEELARQHPNLRTHVRYSEPRAEDVQSGQHDSEGFVDDALLDDLVGDRAGVYYFCGPTPMLAHVHGLLCRRGVAAEDMHYEFFGPREALAG